ncbi:MAG: hypothetical protein WD071_00220 [Pseudohongiella sp.]|uniref:hypothetical protein n=1 Tax=Pseudohongiella sp. TaxID=1979412 RepID=UPI00349FD1F1
MSIFKEDTRCARLRRLGTYRRAAVSKLETSALDALVEIRNSAQERTRRIAEEEGDDSWNVFFESFAVDEANEAITLLHELLVLAAHKAIEQHLVRLAKLAFDVSNERELYKFSKLKALFRKNSIQLEGAIHFHCINELRLVANSVKHGGVVSKELAALPRWKLNQKLWDLQPFYKRVIPLVPLFIEHSVILVEEACGCYVAPSSELKEALNA